MLVGWPARSIEPARTEKLCGIAQLKYARSMESPVDGAAIMLNNRDGNSEAFTAHYRRDAGHIEIDPGESSAASGEEQ